ncbi:MAG: acetylornithine transaminase [Desulfofustis sp.]|nr:acetylornithine transaminase [Desulfofustis sp.]
MENTNQSIKNRADKVFIGNYLRYPAAIVSGAGCELIDADGNRYLDFLSGIAVCALGHCHPAVTRAISEQASRLVHVSNLYYTNPQTELAELLVENTFADKVFMANSGAEANEAAIKLARIASGEGRYEIITLKGSFHGRTLATVAATAQPKFHQGFEPLPQGFVYAEFGDVGAIEQCITPQTCAIMCEPLQGEGGVRPLPEDYLQFLRHLCDKHSLLLVFDEVQTGMGRTGSLFAYQQLGVTPDIMTVAKALGNGMPIGAMVTTEKLASALVPGTHASTFGGNPVACAAAVATLKVMLADGFLDEVQAKGDYFRARLAEVQQKHLRLCSHVRGMGLLNGLVMTEAGCERGADIVNAMYDEHILINFAGNCALRFAPPLIVDRTEIDRAIVILDQVLGSQKA